MKKVCTVGAVFAAVAVLSGCVLIPDGWILNGAWRNSQDLDLEDRVTVLTLDGDMFDMEVSHQVLGSEDFTVTGGRQGTFSLNEGADPKQIDLHITRRYLESGGGVWIDVDEDAFGIYEILDCDHIRMQLSFDGSRPSVFGEDALEYERVE